MADLSGQINAQLKADPRYAAAWSAYQQAAGSGGTDASMFSDSGDRADAARNAQGSTSADAARSQFAYAVRELLKEHGVTNAEDYVVTPDTGQVMYQPDHSVRNTLLLAGAIVLGGAGAQLAGDAIAGGSAASTAGSSAVAPSIGDAAVAAPSSAAASAAGGYGPLAAGYGGASTTAAAPAGIAAVGGAAAPAGGAVAAGGGNVAGSTFGVSNGDIFKTGASLFGNLFGANMQINAADRAAASTAAAAKYAADLQAKASADALAFQYGSAENSFLNNEAARRGNYNQDAAHQRRLGTIGEEVGLGPREIPAYVPGVDPHFGGGAGGAAPAGGGAASTGNPTDDAAILAAATDNYRKLGVAPTGPGSGPTDIAYMTQKIKETGGLTPNNISYWFGPQGRIASELAKAKGGAQPAAAAPVARPYAPLTTATPFMNVVPQSIGYYA